MAKNFRDLLAQSGYGTSRADSPDVLRERVETNIGIKAHSVSSDGTGGPSTLIQDDFGPNVTRALQLPAHKNDIETRGIIQTTRFKRRG
jgi:hypothetical protein